MTMCSQCARREAEVNILLAKLEVARDGLIRAGLVAQMSREYRDRAVRLLKKAIARHRVLRRSYRQLWDMAGRIDKERLDALERLDVLGLLGDNPRAPREGE